MFKLKALVYMTLRILFDEQLGFQMGRDDTLPSSASGTSGKWRQKRRYVRTYSYKPTKLCITFLYRMNCGYSVRVCKNKKKRVEEGENSKRKDLEKI